MGNLCYNMDYYGGISLLMPTTTTTVTVTGLLRDCLGMRAGVVALFIDPIVTLVVWYLWKSVLLLYWVLLLMGAKFLPSF